MTSPHSTCDLLIIGGGINGVGIARDAVGRGLSVTLVEKGDLAGATSSYSSKLIHGGLRYLEHFEFRLVGEALAEREVLMGIAPHLVWPARFVMPHVPELRPRWMIRIGLFLYDNLGRLHGGRHRLPGSAAVRLDAPPYSNGLREHLQHGFIYSDCRTDDARMVIANARDAQARGARILTHVEVLGAQRDAHTWTVRLSNGETITARAVANVAGPWVKHVLNERLGVASNDSVRLVRGSHLVMPKLYEGEHAFILQNDDRRVIFMIPFEGDFTLLGTTDIADDGDPGAPRCTDDEAAYLCRAAGRYLNTTPDPAHAVWRFAGVRPLYDDGTGDPSAVTRDYTLRVDKGSKAQPLAPVLSVFGGKLTTYRHLAEVATSQLAPLLGNHSKPWTHGPALAGGALPVADFATFCTQTLADRYPWLPTPLRNNMAKRHGSDIHAMLGDAKSLTDLGEDFGGGLYERELCWFVTHEWAQSADDVLWRRSKCGLHMTPAQRTRVAEALNSLHASH
jgi:glycerol-3-phosphate dehydrogenase